MSSKQEGQQCEETPSFSTFIYHVDKASCWTAFRTQERSLYYQAPLPLITQSSQHS